MTRKNHIKIESLKLKNDIDSVFKCGKSKSYDGIIVKVLENSLDFQRFCIIPSHGFGNAIERNKLKRRIRNLFRNFSDFFNSYYDIVIIVKVVENKTNFQDLSFKLEKTFRKLMIIKDGEITHL